MNRTDLQVDEQLIERISSLFDLRTPNERALRAVIEQIHAPDRRFITAGGFPEVVADLATGVGKTYLMAALVEYVAQQGVRNVLVVTPNSTIQRKTIANFDAASGKHVAGAELVPFIVTPDNFRTAQTGALLRDPSRLKVFVFNVQQLTKPTAANSRRTHTPDEVLGQALYDHLYAARDLLAVADEHHVYREQATKFSAAIRDLEPIALVGLTATPDRSDIPRIAFEYTLGEAIADGYVKIPVIVYRRGGMTSDDVQLGDAVALLERKERSYRQHADATRSAPVRPVLFVVTQTVKEANAVGDRLAGDGYIGDGAAVLVITEQSSNEALAMLDDVESQTSPIRAIVSVNKLREGWDVKNIAVIVALRKLASESLTEQILGRGLRLPYGRRTGWDDVDQVDLVVHDKWERLLAQKDVLKQRMMTPSSAIDVDESGAATGPQLTDQEREAAREHARQHGGLPDAPDLLAGGTSGQGLGVPQPATGGHALPSPSTLEGQGTFDDFGITLKPLDDEGVPERPQPTRRIAGAPQIVFPRRDRLVEAGQFSVADIPLLEARSRGRRLTDNAVIPLHRTKIDAERDADGKDVTMITGTAEEAAAHQQTLQLDTVRADLVTKIKRLSCVSWSRQERGASAALVEAFLEGAGEETRTWNDTRFRQAARGIEDLVRGAAQQTRPTVRHQITEVVVPVEPVDVMLSETLRFGQDPYVKGALFGGWTRSIMPFNSFDAKNTEWEIAAILEASSSDIVHWLRLPSAGEVYIPWGGGRYYPDFIAIDGDGVRWLIEGKDNRSVRDGDPAVLEKKEAAETWARHVNANGDYGTWRYLFGTEADVVDASGSWELLKAASSTD
ncbi:DEAD/DEAH box helicase [Brachybacterium tyrofermentans]|uniref:DEAD/DEAH box helicase n=1 Tax=Brachybacterium tyrofermentans TaxID=47848 RepID=UPI003FD69677